MNKTIVSLAIILCLFAKIASASPVKLNKLNIDSIAGNNVKITLEFSGPIPTPTHFTVNNPDQIVFDFKNVENKLPKILHKQTLNLGPLIETEIVNQDDTLRLLLNVNGFSPFIGLMEDNKYIITVSNATIFNSKDKIQQTTQDSQDTNYSVQYFDFKRGEDNSGQLIINLANDQIPIDFTEQGDKTIITIKNATIHKDLTKEYDVIDFGTPIKYFSIKNINGNVIITATTSGDYEKTGYQINNQYILEARPYTTEEKLTNNLQNIKFSGDNISLNFQDVSVRAVLQLFGDFIDLNMIISDSVTGNITLLLEDTPWDQALDFILKAKGLTKRESANILLISTTEEAAKRDEAEKAAMQALKDLEPLKTAFISINYAKASEIKTILGTGEKGLLSAKGEATTDERTNTLIIKDTEESIREIKKLIDKLDIPIKQVSIEAQIVVTSNTIIDQFGLKFGTAAKIQAGKYPLGIANTLKSAVGLATGDITPEGFLKTGADDTLFTNFTDNGSNTLGLSLAKLPGGTLLNLELSALESESSTKIISRPKVITLDQQSATIESGTEIAVTVNQGDNGGNTTEFKKATLKLEVTPQISPNNRINLILNVNKDSPIQDGNGSIDTTNLSTKIQVANGETIVLGGVYSLDTAKTHTRIPFFSSLPIIGKLFKDDTNKNERKETLFFITPKIIENLG